MNIFYDANKIYAAGEKAIKSAAFKHDNQLFEINHLVETAQLQKKLMEKSYKPAKGKDFVIKERGKRRNIVTSNMTDKTVNHLICDYVLSSAISPFLIYDNSASQENKGVTFHRKRIETHLHRYYREHKSNNGYVLLIDFSNYYANIPHDLCLKNIQKLLKNVNAEERQMTLWILKNIFNIAKTNKGVDIGSQPSQNIGVCYPFELDNYIKIVKSCKYYRQIYR